MRTSRYLLILLCLAFALRLGLVLLLCDIHTGPPESASGDDMQFHTFASNLAQGKGFTTKRGEPTAFRAPGFPFLLAGQYALLGESPVLVYTMLCLLGALSCALTYGLAREFFPEQWAQVAGLLAAFHLPHMYFATVYLSESLFIPLLLLGSWLLVRYLKCGAIYWVILAGLTLGYAALVRPYALLLGPIFGVVLVWASWWHPRESSRRDCDGAARAEGKELRTVRVVPTLALVACLVVVVLPWTLRNYLVFHHPVLITTNGGSTFYGGNNDVVLNERKFFGYWVSTTELPHRDLIDAAPNEVEHDRVEWRLGMAWVREHLGSMPRLLVYKLVRLWIWPHDFGDHREYQWLRLAGFAPCWFLCTLGIGICLITRRFWTPPWLLVHAALFATILTALIFWGSPRFRDANLGALMLYATVGLQWLVSWLPGRRRKQLGGQGQSACEQSHESSGPGTQARTAVLS